MTIALETPTLTIRAATEADIPQIVKMGLRFATAEYAISLPADPDRIAMLARNLMGGENSVVLVSESSEGAVVGMIAMMVYDQPMTNELVATEIAWWMEPEQRGSSAGIRLLKAGEQWARARGARKLQMIAPTDRVGQFYERLGFQRIEIHYQRSL